MCESARYRASAVRDFKVAYLVDNAVRQTTFRSADPCRRVEGRGGG